MEIKDVKTREDFIQFLNELKRDFNKFYEKNKDKSELEMSTEWQNILVGHYLEAIARCLNDSNNLKNVKKLSWSDLANIIMSGKYYE